MKLTNSTGNTVLEANCSESYQLAADQLLNDLASMGISFKAGTTVLYGWILLKLVARDEHLVVTAPDITHGNPEIYQDSLDIVLKVLTEQAHLLNELGLEGEPALYLEKVVLHKKYQEHTHLYMERQPKTSADDSGWYIGPELAAPPAKEDLTTVHVHELLHLMPAITGALALPEGFLATLEANRVTQIYDKENKPLFSEGKRLI